MSIIKEKLKSVQVKLFLVFCIMVVVIILFIIVLNNFVLETFYLYSKQNSLMEVYNKINYYYNNNSEIIDIELELEKIAINNNFDILIKKKDQDTSVYISNRDFLSTLGQISDISYFNKNNEEKNVVYESENKKIERLEDKKNGLNFILLSSKLDNGYSLYIRMPISTIEESVAISNKFLYLIGAITILIAGIVISIISRRFTSPILELNDIAKKMSKLDFSKKYIISKSDDEINNLGKSINTMSDTLERIIRQLKNTNIELEKDIEKKSKIDEMRMQFISDVSHELKTPIALIQGYAEGIVEDISQDEESRKFYAEVILDESNKMDRLVKQLLELMKLEYGVREFKNEKFNIVEQINQVLLKNKMIIKNQKITIDFEISNEVIEVFADPFYIEQVINNYFTNALKNVTEINGEKIVKIDITKKDNCIRVSVFNTGSNIPEEEINRIWNRFYKMDNSRNRENGGTGIGLSIVKAIMNNYNNNYGVINKIDGVEFYFEL